MKTFVLIVLLEKNMLSVKPGGENCAGASLLLLDLDELINRTMNSDVNQKTLKENIRPSVCDPKVHLGYTAIQNTPATLGNCILYLFWFSLSDIKMSVVI